MKDSIGSSVLIKIFLFFIVIFIIMMASIINYTKSFRIKNQIINIIERNSGYNATAKAEIEEYIKNQKVFAECQYYGVGTEKISAYQGNRCEIQEYEQTNAMKSNYYKVRVYAAFTLPLVKQSLNIPITGETKVNYIVPANSEESVEYNMVYDTPKVDIDLSLDVQKVSPKNTGWKCPPCYFDGWDLISDEATLKRYCPTHLEDVYKEKVAGVVTESGKCSNLTVSRRLNCTETVKYSGCKCYASGLYGFITRDGSCDNNGKCICSWGNPSSTSCSATYSRTYLDIPMEKESKLVADEGCKVPVTKVKQQMDEENGKCYISCHAYLGSIHKTCMNFKRYEVECPNKD